MNSNHIRASFFPRGNKFTNVSDAGFLVPYPSSQRLSTIFASSPWIGGYDDAGNLKMATETYPSPTEQDYTVGPLNYIGVPYDSVCGHFDHAWVVNYEDIDAHRKDFFLDQDVDEIRLPVFLWPGRGNTFFESYYGFKLPSDNFGLAPFWDQNANGLYDPIHGDYPCIRFSAGGSPYVPDQILWMVFNDLDAGDSSGIRPLRFEIQLTAFAFHCLDNDVLNNTLFNMYRILNRSLVPLDSAFFGFWTDYDLGCYTDDFVGCDSTRNTEFVYNGDPKDGDDQLDCSNGQDTYGAHPPVQSMTYLDHPMHSFIMAKSPTKAGIGRYRLLNGQWEDGSPIRSSGNGYDPSGTGTPTHFLYHGDPRDSVSWAAVNVLDTGENVMTVSSVSLGRLNPGAIRQVTTAYMYHSDPSLGYLDHITLMENNIDSMRTRFNDFSMPCSPFQYCTGTDCVWPGDFDHNGIADHRDYLAWALFNGTKGPAREGLISWRGHFAETWSEQLEGLNAKHSDGDGNGVVNLNDIEINSLNFLETNQYYVFESDYPTGNDLVLSSSSGIDDQGRIKFIRVKAGHDLGDVLGLTFEVEYDTSLFTRTHHVSGWPEDTARLIFNELYDPAALIRYSVVQTNHQSIDIDSGFPLVLLPGSGLSIRPGRPVPDSTVIRLKNLKGIDAQGRDLLLGSQPLVVYKEGVTTTKEIWDPGFTFYPNPASTFILIEPFEKTALKIFDLNGHCIKQFPPFREPLWVDLSWLPGGIYFLQSASKGEVVKLIKL